MRWIHYIPIVMAVLLMYSAPDAPAVGERQSGNVLFAYESLNGCGISYATDGTVKLGDTVGQAGFTSITHDGGANELLTGFWKAEGACILYDPSILGLANGSLGPGITFAVINSNRYEVLYCTTAEDALDGGPGSYTNIVATFTGEGLAGTTTTIWDNVSSATNAGRFYLIKCQE